MTLNKNVSASLMYGAAVTLALAAAAAPALINAGEASAQKKNMDTTCRDIMNGKKEADVVEHVGCYGRNGFNLHIR